MKTICKIIIPFFLLNIGGSFINAQKVNLSDFVLMPYNKQVLIYWTIDSGPTCNGISIWHSKDSLHFTEIGSIPGICGSSTSKKPYSFVDENPALGDKHFYKIRLGSNQYSEIKAIRLRYREQGKLYVIPNPSHELMSIEFNNENAKTHSLTIFSSAGKTVFHLENTNADKIEINTGMWENGTYIAMLSDESSRVITTKLVVYH